MKLRFKIICFFLCVLCGTIFSQWDKYPTYDEYLAMMSKFEADYPNLCKIVEFGQSVQERKLLAAKISDSIDTNEPEPAFLYTATLHGDALAGYSLMLRLTDYLLSNYGNDPLVTELVDNIEIWIAPNLNPDGTYYGGNDTPENARRKNANNKDLKLNFPVLPGVGTLQQPEKETKAVMELVSSNNFVMSAGLLAGLEEAIYPWCCWESWIRSHADSLWFENLCKEYADTVHLYCPSGYFTGEYGNGYRCCYYPPGISGTLIDYLNYYEHCREITLYISLRNVVNPSDLTDFWEWNYLSLLNYIKQVLYGIRGKVTDALTGAPLNAKVFIENHDKDSSWVFSYLPHGDYYRPVYEGTYDVTFSCDGYHSKTVTGVQVENNQAKVLDVQLDISTNIILQGNNLPVISIDIVRGIIRICYHGSMPYYGNISLEIYDIHGKRMETLTGSYKQSGSYTIKWEKDGYSSGIYYFRLKTANASIISKAVLVR